MKWIRNTVYNFFLVRGGGNLEEDPELESRRMSSSSNNLSTKNQHKIILIQILYYLDIVTALFMNALIFFYINYCY